ncbi:MAG: iron-sulfur cluster assembly protein [Hyphomicrobiaceae bacterium]|nr:iron-sulfur cluster assembly protein [Hyphomicrobiaceae bacterium]
MEQLREDVWLRLSRVTDPELDEAVTDMGFIESYEIRDGGHVHVAFRLPTYWCSPNFAFMMGHDMRVSVMALPWVKHVDVVLGEHMYVDQINRGVNGGLSFQETFGDASNGELEEIRQTFLRKAFQWRQEALITDLLHRGAKAGALVDWTIDRLREASETEASRHLITRYLERRNVPGAFAGGDCALVSLDGTRLDASSMTDYLRAIRRIRTNAEFNGALCRRLLDERFATEPLNICQSGRATP